MPSSTEWQRILRHSRRLLYLALTISASVGGGWIVSSYINIQKTNASFQAAGNTDNIIISGNSINAHTVTINIRKEAARNDLAKYSASLEQALLSPEPNMDPKVLRAELHAVRNHLDDVDNFIATLAAKYEAASRFIENVEPKAHPDDLLRAQQALARGDTELAEAVLRGYVLINNANSSAASFELGQLAEAKARFSEALSHYKHAVDLTPDRAKFRLSYAFILYTLGQYSDAEREYRHVIVRRPLINEEPSAITPIINSLAFVIAQRGRCHEAEPILRESIKLQNEQPQPDIAILANSLNILGSCLRRLNRFEEAEPLLIRSVNLSESRQPLDNRLLASSLSTLADLRRYQGNFIESRHLLEQALHLRADAFGPQHPYVATTMSALAVVRTELGELADAEAILLTALSIRTGHFGSHHPVVATTLHNLAMTSLKKGDRAKAMEYFQKALHIRSVSLERGHPSALQNVLEIAKLMEGTGEKSEASALLDKFFEGLPTSDANSALIEEAVFLRSRLEQSKL